MQAKCILSLMPKIFTSLGRYRRQANIFEDVSPTVTSSLFPLSLSTLRNSTAPNTDPGLSTTVCPLFRYGAASFAMMRWQNAGVTTRMYSTPFTASSIFVVHFATAPKPVSQPLISKPPSSITSLRLSASSGTSYRHTSCPRLPRYAA